MGAVAPHPRMLYSSAVRAWQQRPSAPQLVDGQEGSVGGPTDRPNADDRLAVEGAINVGVQAVGILVEDGRAYASTLDLQGHELAGDRVVEAVPHVQQVLLAVRAVDEALAVKRLGDV